MTRRHVQISVMTASRGFTMAEVLFAIIVLGIGLILLAAAFPVGIAQVEVNQDRTNANLVARHAYDQLTKVPAAGVYPSPTWVSQPLSTTLVGSPINNYGDQGNQAGKPLVQGLIDGADLLQPPVNNPNVADLRVKLVFPVSIYADNPPGTTNPTWADDCPQDQSYVNRGRAAYDGLNGYAYWLYPWGFRLDGNVWQENVQWVWPADRRYYWYAFYRQMNEGTYPHPLKPLASWTAAETAAVQAAGADHVSRRTYRVTIVACKLGGGQAPVRTPAQMAAACAAGDTTQTPAAYAAQWGTAPDNTLWPIRVPDTDAQLLSAVIALGATPDLIVDAPPNVPVETLISNGGIRRGGIVLDCWGNTFKIIDFGGKQVRLDRPLLPAGQTLDDLGPLWFNPNAIAVFPTIVVKQADLP